MTDGWHGRLSNSPPMTDNARFGSAHCRRPKMSTTPPPAESSSDPSGAAPRWLALAEVVLIVAVMFIHGGWPAPEVNETHYLTKAKHYWDPAWCRHDFFLNTADAHQVFYWSFGWVSRLASLPAMAWIGRLLTWTLLAWSWRRLSWTLVPRPLAAVLSAALLVALVDRCHMAGEWLVGGVEAKGFAYALVLVGLERLVRGRWLWAAAALGAAMAMHAVVGGWALVGAAVASLVGPARPTARQIAAAALVAGVVALPGIVPVLRLNLGVDPATALEAARIHVFERLAHHMVPQRFAAASLWGLTVPFWLRQTLLWGVWLLLVWRTSTGGQAWRRLHGFVGAMIGISIVGWGVSLLQYVDELTAASMLRFYWFRMSDVFVPVGAALLVSAAAASGLASGRRSGVAWLAVGMAVAGYHLGEVTWRGRAAGTTAPADAKLLDAVAWREMCRWIAEHTPADAVILTPRLAQSLRWYAGRAEVVSNKDVPQDAESIVQWYRRLQDVHRAGTHAPPSPWHGTLTELTPQRLRQLGKRYGADYLLTEAKPRLLLQRIGPSNRSYALYRLRDP